MRPFLLARSKEQLTTTRESAPLGLCPPVNSYTGRFLPVSGGVCPAQTTFPTMTNLTLNNHLQGKMSNTLNKGSLLKKATKSRLRFSRCFHQFSRSLASRNRSTTI